MSPTASPRARLAHIRDEIAALTAALGETDYPTFAATYWMVRTTERAILIVAEAAKALPKDLTARYPEVEWQALNGMANILRHEYQRVEPRVLWRVVIDSFPRLASVVEQMLAEDEARG